MDISEISYAWAFLGVIIALGAISIACLQILNELTPLRSILHGIWLRTWIHERAVEYDAMIKGKGSPKAAATTELSQPSEDVDTSWVPPLNKEQESQALDMLVAVATGGHGLAFLGLPTNQLVGQINAAAQVVLENPIAYFPILSVLSQPTLPFVRPFGWGTPKTKLPMNTHLADLNEICKFAKSNPMGREEPTPEYLQARTRIGHAIQRNLDGIQITLTNRSAQTSLALALVISILLASLVLQPPKLLNVLLIGAGGGYLATVLGDIFNALRRFGQR
jgi:hypothetical protein